MDKLSEPYWTRSNITDLKGYRITHMKPHKYKGSIELWGKKHFWHKSRCIMLIATSGGMSTDVYDGNGNNFTYKLD